MTTRVRIVRPENPPPDHGCKAGGPSCLACRLPACVHDLSPRDPDYWSESQERYRTDPAYRERERRRKHRKAAS